MTKLDLSLERFSKALDTLEARIVRQTHHKKSNNDFERDIAALREDRARLAEELGTVKAEAKALEGLTSQVSAKLDMAISDIRDVLNHS